LQHGSLEDTQYTKITIVFEIQSYFRFASMWFSTSCHSPELHSGATFNMSFQLFLSVAR